VRKCLFFLGGQCCAILNDSGKLISVNKIPYEDIESPDSEDANLSEKCSSFFQTTDGILK
jgi:hypothetical protein